LICSFQGQNPFRNELPSFPVPPDLLLLLDPALLLLIPFPSLSLVFFSPSLLCGRVCDCGSEKVVQQILEVLPATRLPLAIKPTVAREPTASLTYLPACARESR
jgi:hypothetical protein